MFSFRILALALATLTAPTAFAASHRPTADAEARTEMAAPTLSNGSVAARRATAGLADVLRLSTAQTARLQARTEKELRNLNLAATPADVAAAEQHYLLAVGRVLSPSQFAQYCALRGALGTPLDYLREAEGR